MEISEERKKAGDTNYAIGWDPGVEDKSCLVIRKGDTIEVSLLGHEAEIVYDLLASREAQAAENAARVIVETVEEIWKSDWASTDDDTKYITYRCVDAARSAAAQFLKKDE